MRTLSPAGRQAIHELAQRHGFSPAAVLCMLEAVIQGRGSMAQFDYPEFGGSGQWMPGGMTMLSDMFNYTLKGRVEGLCHDLAHLVASQPDLMHGGSFQSQSQSGGYGQQQGGYGGSQHQQTGAGPVGPVSLFVPPAPGRAGDWWGADLRWPTSTGAQNGVRYADFAQARRLAIEVSGRVTIYGIARTGRRFRIERATVWNLTDDAGRRCGQAATFRTWRYLADAAPEPPR